MARRPRRNVGTRFDWTTFIYLLLVLVAPMIILGHVHAQQEASESEFSYGTVIGIDLGTTYSRVGVKIDGNITIINDDQGNRMTPSYVAFTDEGSLVGHPAKDQYSANMQRTILDSKRLIGRKYMDEEVQWVTQHHLFNITEKNGMPTINVEVDHQMKTFTPEEVLANILGKMKELAENHLGEKVTHAVVTVPMYFNDQQRQSVKDAGDLVGLKVLRLVNEPTSAAIGHGLDQEFDDKLIVVYNLGDTFEVTVFEVDNGVFEVMATTGNTHLGGQDFDRRVIDYLVQLWIEKYNIDVTNDSNTMAKLRRDVEKAKLILSSEMSTEIGFSYDGKNVSEVLTRDKFEELNMDLFQHTLKSIEKVLKDANTTKIDIQDIVLAGGSTNIPKIQSMIEEYFGKNISSATFNPDEAAVYGVSMQAGVLSGEEGFDYVFGEPNPLSLGIETTGNIMTTIIPRYYWLPFQRSRVLTTVFDNQSTILIQIFQGESDITKGNTLVGKFELTGIPPAPRGVPQIEISFNLLSSEFLRVIAGDDDIGKSYQTLLDYDHILFEEDFSRNVAKADAYTELDEIFRGVQSYTLEPDGSNQNKTMNFFDDI